jgi:DNA-binding Xre family transcriptional regulator
VRLTVKSKLIEALALGLKQVQKNEGEWTDIANNAGISRSTVVKIAAGQRPNITVSTFENVYNELVRRGHVQSTFVYESVDHSDRPNHKSITCNG